MLWMSVTVLWCFRDVFIVFFVFPCSLQRSVMETIENKQKHTLEDIEHRDIMKSVKTYIRTFSPPIWRLQLETIHLWWIVSNWIVLETIENKQIGKQLKTNRDQQNPQRFTWISFETIEKQTHWLFFNWKQLETIHLWFAPLAVSGCCCRDSQSVQYFPKEKKLFFVPFPLRSLRHFPTVFFQGQKNRLLTHWFASGGRRFVGPPGGAASGALFLLTFLRIRPFNNT